MYEKKTWPQSTIYDFHNSEISKTILTPSNFVTSKCTSITHFLIHITCSQLFSAIYITNTFVVWFTVYYIKFGRLSGYLKSKRKASVLIQSKSYALIDFEMMVIELWTHCICLSGNKYYIYASYIHLQSYYRFVEY